MKHASSDASASVIVVAAVAMLTAVFFTIIWPMIRQDMTEDSNCANAVCDVGYMTTGAHQGQAMCYNPSQVQKGFKTKGEDIFYCPYRG